jgi:hypothetical protein
MAKEEREIKEAKKDGGAVTGHGLDGPVAKKEESSNRETCSGKDAGGEFILEIETRDDGSADHRHKVVFKTAGRRDGHTVKFIEGDKDDDGDSRTKKGRRSAPHQQNQEWQKDNPGNNPLFNNKSP